MKILIAFSHRSEIEQCLTNWGVEEDLQPIQIRNLEIHFIETGYTLFETSFHMAKALCKKHYQLVVFAGLANSLNRFMKVGTPINVINEVLYQYGQKSDEEFHDAYQLTWLNKNDFPHKRGGFINLTNAYFNIFLPFMKSAAITCTQLGGNTEELELKQSHYPMHIETSNGLGFHYAALRSGFPFYQIRVIAHNYIDQENDKEKAIQELNESLTNIIDLL